MDTLIHYFSQCMSLLYGQLCSQMQERREIEYTPNAYERAASVIILTRGVFLLFAYGMLYFKEGGSN